MGSFPRRIVVLAGSMARSRRNITHEDLVRASMEDGRPTDDRESEVNGSLSSWLQESLFYQFCGRGATGTGCPAGKLMICVLARVLGGQWPRIRRPSAKVRTRPGMPPVAQGGVWCYLIRLITSRYCTARCTPRIALLRQRNVCKSGTSVVSVYHVYRVPGSTL